MYIILQRSLTPLPIPWVLPLPIPWSLPCQYLGFFCLHLECFLYPYLELSLVDTLGVSFTNTLGSPLPISWVLLPIPWVFPLAIPWAFPCLYLGFFCLYLGCFPYQYLGLSLAYTLGASHTNTLGSPLPIPWALPCLYLGCFLYQYLGLALGYTLGGSFTHILGSPLPIPCFFSPNPWAFPCRCLINFFPHFGLTITYTMGWNHGVICRCHITLLQGLRCESSSKIHVLVRTGRSIGLGSSWYHSHHGPLGGGTCTRGLGSWWGWGLGTWYIQNRLVPWKEVSEMPCYFVNEILDSFKINSRRKLLIRISSIAGIFFGRRAQTIISSVSTKILSSIYEAEPSQAEPGRAGQGRVGQGRAETKSRGRKRDLRKGQGE